MKKLIQRMTDWDFIRMGKGIESRYARCADYWLPHLECTKDFVANNVKNGGRIAVLGAGRLLDINLSLLIPRFDEVHLYDADPTVIPSWKEASGSFYGSKVFGHIEDVTGTLARWSRGVARAVRSGRLKEYLSELEVGSGAWEHERYDGVISLNIIGQLPLYWRDRVLSHKPHVTDEEGAALKESMGRLQIAHINALQRGSAGWGIAISDTEYYTYRVDESGWSVDPALHGKSRDAFDRTIDRVAGACGEAWLWHLAPQFVESDSEGAIHRVEARAWSNPSDSLEKTGQ